MRTVERGAELLDVVQPGWETKIDLDKLDLASCSACILGQIYMDAHPRVRNKGEAYERQLAAFGVGVGQAGKYGFNTLTSMGRFENLTEAWRKLIRRRLS